MALIFYNHRKGYDEPPRLLPSWCFTRSSFLEPNRGRGIWRMATGPS